VILFVFGCQYQCNQLPGNTLLLNDMLYVEWDVKSYLLTHPVLQKCQSEVSNSAVRDILLPLILKVKESRTQLQALGTELNLVSWQSAHTWLSHKPGGRLPIVSTRPSVTFPVKEITPLAGVKLYCLVTEAHSCKYLAQGDYTVVPSQDSEPATCESQACCPANCITASP